MVAGGPPEPAGGARARILETAYDLFSRHGVNVGIDRVVAEAGVAKMTLYRHFPSKEELVLEVLRLREQRWTRGWLQREVERRSADGRTRLLVVFELLGEWFARSDFEGCPFIRTLMETDLHSPAHEAAAAHLGAVVDLLTGYAVEARVAHPATVGAQLQLLIAGAIVAASRGDRSAASRAEELARAMLDGEAANGWSEAPRTQARAQTYERAEP